MARSLSQKGIISPLMADDKWVSMAVLQKALTWSAHKHVEQRNIPAW
jgi:hypothetical protein